MSLSGIPSLPNGLGLRPSTPSDTPFIQSLFTQTRPELQLIDGEQDFIDSIVDMQMRAQTQGYGDQYPNAMYFIVEKLGTNIGRVTIDFGSNFVHIIDIAFIPQAQGKGYGGTVIQAVQETAKRLMAPVSLTVAKNNPAAKKLYMNLGFAVDEDQGMYEMMVWYPGRKN